MTDSRRPSLRPDTRNAGSAQGQRWPLRSRKVVLHSRGDDIRSRTRIVTHQVDPPGPGEVVVRNRYAGVNGLFDVALARGLVGYRPLVPPVDMGVETVGHVEAVGAGVHDLSPGDAVSLAGLGCGYREYVTVPVGLAWPVPAATPAYVALRPTGVSALVALEQVGQLGTGQTVAISAAAGGLGHFLVQLAKLAGNHVIGICGGVRKTAMLRDLGCDRIINHRAERVRDVLAGEYPAGVDLAIDTVGGEMFDAFVDNLAVRGRVVTAGYASDMTGRGPQLVTRPRVYAQLYWKGASIRAFQNWLLTEFHDAATRRLIDMYQGGQLRVCIDPVPFRGLEQVFDAVDRLTSGRSMGKVILQVEPAPDLPRTGLPPGEKP